MNSLKNILKTSFALFTLVTAAFAIVGIYGTYYQAWNRELPSVAWMLTEQAHLPIIVMCVVVLILSITCFNFLITKK